MCRLLCYMGVRVPMDILVTRPEHSLVSQSRDASFHPGCGNKRNIRVNGDGFGIAWYTPRRIEEGGCVVKFPTPAWSSTNLLNIAKFVESSLVFAHVRASSDGAVLVGNVNHENTHPFKYKRYTFMHNGGIPGFDRMKRQMLALLGDEAYRVIEGTTDSEVCFAFFLDELPNTDDQLSAADIAQALRRTIVRIVSAVVHAAAATGCGVGGGDDIKGGGSKGFAGVSGACSAAETPAASPAMSLNFCVTDGRHIVCSRYRNHPRQDPPSLFVLSGAGFACEEEGSCLRLTAAEPLQSVVISSEPLCRSTKSWKLVPRNSMVIVEGRTSVEATSVDDGNSEDGHGVTSDDGSTDSCGGATGPAPQGETFGLGLVSSISYEPLRCHPSDAPPPDDAAASNLASLPSSCSELGNSIGDNSLGNKKYLANRN